LVYLESERRETNLCKNLDRYLIPIQKKKYML